LQLPTTTCQRLTSILPIKDELSRLQVEQLLKIVKNTILNYTVSPSIPGIVHVIGPELGITQPGMTIVCGDSQHQHTAHLVPLHFGIVPVKWKWYLHRNAFCRQSKSMRINIEGELQNGWYQKISFFYYSKDHRKRCNRLFC